MKKLILFAVLPILFMSCISSGVKVSVNKDGSGEVIQTFKIKRDFVGFLSMSEEPTDPNLIDMDALEMTARTMGEGVTLSRVEPMPEDSPYAGYIAYFDFKDISSLKVSASPSTSPEAADESSNDWVTFDFDRGATSKLVMYMGNNTPNSDNQNEMESTGSAEPGEDEIKSEVGEGMGEQLKEIYRDMHYWMEIEVQGQITSTNASFTEGSLVTIFDINFEKIVQNAELFEKVTGDDPGSMKEYKEELSEAGVFIDDQPEIYINFR